VNVHTPTPWSLVDSTEIYGADSRRVGDLAEVVQSRRQLADAAHIVRCVNHHDQLVAALQLLTDEARACARYNVATDALRDAGRAADALLSRLKDD
jgi:hypothetical protein